MIIGIGVDSIEIARIQKAVEKNRFISRVFTVDEISYCEERKQGRVESYAGMFAAKEAAVKALGSGFRGISPIDIEVQHDEWGAPQLRFNAQAHRIAENKQVIRAHLSISHDQSKAIAFVVLEKEDGV